MKLSLNKQKTDKILDFLTWMALASIVLWVIAKSFGWINTPIFVELYPMIAAAFVVGRMFQQSEDTKRDLGEVKIELKEVKHELKDVKHEVSGLDNRMGNIELRLKVVEHIIS